MEKKVVTGTMLGLLLLLNMLTLTFNIPLSLEGVTFTTSLKHHVVTLEANGENPSASTRLHEKTWDFIRAYNWSNFAKVDNDSSEMIIGVSDAKPNSYEQLRHFIAESQGTLVDTISMNGEPVAVVVDIPEVSAFTFAEIMRKSGLSTYIEPNLRFQASFVPNDPYWPQQWSPVKIGADYAWNTTRGDPSILVAVIDTGVDWKHPDLVSNYVALGYDWVNNDTDPMDDHGHGTHCAGIIAASLNNGLGIAGLAQVHIMAEKGLDAWGSGTEDDLAKAIIHTVDQGADIISCSWSSYFPSELIHEAIKYAYERGVIVVAAAGNDKTKRRSYPAAYDEVIAVSATNQYDNPATFTNLGDWIELAAPGVDIYSTVCNNSYSQKSGTSMSSPHVAAVAALAWSKFQNAARDWVRLWLRYTSDDLGDEGFDNYYGYGRTNARRAVEEAPPDHDVVISSCQSPPYVDPGNQCLLAIDVVNFGAENETGITVQLLVNGSVVYSATIDSLAAYNSVAVNCSWTPAIGGIYNVTCYVVPVYNEMNIKNNVMSRYVFVGIKTIDVPAFYPTIQKAIDAAGSGFTILVSAGMYYENLVLDKTVSLIGVNRGTTIIDANGTGTVVSVAASNVDITNFTIRNSGHLWLDSGILLYNSNSVTIRNNTMTLNNFGIYLEASFNCTFALNNATGNAHFGFMIKSASNCTFSENIVTSNFEGIVLDSCPNSTLCKNDLKDNIDGIWLASCPNSILYENRIATGVWGLSVQYSPNSKLRNNIMTGKGWREIYNLDVWGWELSDFTLDIDVSNTINGKPVYYWVSKRDQTVPSDAGYVGLINSTNITVEGLDLRNNGVGILLAYTNNSLVTNNMLTNNEWTVQLSHSWGNSLYGNNLVENGAGISLDASSENSLYENNVTNVFRHWGILINAQSNNNSVYRNNLADIFDDGVMISYDSNNNSVFGNNITNSDLCAIDVRYSSDNNLIYGNNVIDNFKPIRLYDSSNNIIFHNNFKNYVHGPEVYAPVNEWDNGYPSGGNYWSDYTGLDEKSGPNQDQLGSDGIGDTPYIFDDCNRDRYPLMNPWATPWIGDFDGDYDVDYDDIVYFVDAYIKYWSGLGKDPACDFDRDCDIDYDDVLTFVSSYIDYWTS